jgi:hypothetical protein
MSNLGKQVQQQLPPGLEMSTLLSTGLQDAIRKQTFQAWGSGIGMVVGALLAAWLLGAMPVAWNAVTADANGLLWGFLWLSRLLGVAMGAATGATLFRHITYTVVAKALLALREHPAATEAEKAWLTFELAAMRHALQGSAWTTPAQAPVITIFGMVLWLALTVAALTAGDSIHVTGLEVMQGLLACVVFSTGWQVVYVAPPAMRKLDMDAARVALANHLREGAPSPQPILKHRDSLTNSDLRISIAIGMFIAAVGLQIGIAAVQDWVKAKEKEAAQVTAFNAKLNAVSFKLASGSKEATEKALETLKASQYQDQKLVWATYSSEMEKGTYTPAPFRAGDCTLLNPERSEMVVCSVMKVPGLTELLRKQVSKQDWWLFNGRALPSIREARP